jgi:hypothetical protein
MLFVSVCNWYRTIGWILFNRFYDSNILSSVAKTSPFLYMWKYCWNWWISRQSWWGIFRRAARPAATRGHPCALLLPRGRPAPLKKKKFFIGNLWYQLKCLKLLKHFIDPKRIEILSVFPCTTQMAKAAPCPFPYEALISLPFWNPGWSTNHWSFSVVIDDCNCLDIRSNSSDYLLVCYQLPFGLIMNDCHSTAFILLHRRWRHTTRIWHTEYNLIILSHIVLAKFTITSRELFWSLLPFHANH